MCGWYIYCYSSTLRYGPPHDYKWKEFVPWKGNGEYVHTGDSVGVVVDMTKGELSFVCCEWNEPWCCVRRSSLDKPLVPCVVLLCNGDPVGIMT